MRCILKAVCPVYAADSTFLLFSKKQEIRGVDLEAATYNVIPALTVPWVYNPLALDYEPTTNRLFWTDDDTVHGQNGIHTATLNGTDVHTIIDSGRSMVRKWGGGAYHC